MAPTVPTVRGKHRLLHIHVWQSDFYCSRSGASRGRHPFRRTDSPRDRYVVAGLVPAIEPGRHVPRCCGIAAGLDPSAASAGRGHEPNRSMRCALDLELALWPKHTLEVGDRPRIDHGADRRQQGGNIIADLIA